ncbi:MAG: hypothetical protein JSR24_11360 [Proteobacteria bacterium]|nr:hypothetical protein [Pseudomonadota bacterium]
MPAEIAADTRTRTPIVLAVALVLLLFGCSTASSASAGEVHFDPEGPAEKEYALPLEQARAEALGTGGGKSHAGAETAPLFGVGIGEGTSGGEPRGVPRTSRSSSGREGSKHHDHQQKGTSKPNSGRPHPEGRGTSGGAVRKVFVPEASYPAGQGLLIVAGLLLVGLVAGVGLRSCGRRLST